MRTLLLLLVCATPLAAQVTAGVSGVSGDGIPDIYYDPSNGLLALDTDGNDFVALLVSDERATFFDGCILCNEGSIPGPGIGHHYLMGHVAGSTHWIRAFPLNGMGPEGVFVLARGATGLSTADFPEIFDDTATDELWSARFVTDSSGQYFTNVTISHVYDPDLDFSGDFSNTVGDLDLLTMVGDLEAGVAVTPQNTQFDLTADGVIDGDDIDEFLQRAALYTRHGQPLRRGDANLDGFVDGQDFNIWNQAKFTQQDRWSLGDFSGNGNVDGADFVYWNSNKFMSRFAVPEPSLSVALWLALWVIGRRRLCGPGTPGL